MPTSPEQWELFWRLVGAICFLLVALGSWAVWEQRRNSRNIHKLRNLVQKIIVALARKGIDVPPDSDP